MGRTAKQDLVLMKQLEKAIENGEIKGPKRIFRARKQIAALRFSAKKKSEKVMSQLELPVDGTPVWNGDSDLKATRDQLRAENERLKSQRTVTQPTSSQPTLPGFLSMINNPRLEEMVAEKIAEALVRTIVVPAKTGTDQE